LRSSGSARGGAFAALFKIPPSDVSFYKWDLKYDQNGFRNVPDLTRADIAVVGSSYIEGTTISDSDLVTNLLAQQMGGIVENLGHNSYGPAQELITLKRYGLPLHPRTVVWAFTEIELRQETLYDLGRRGHPTFLSSFIDRSFTRTAYRKVRSQIIHMESEVRQAFTPENDEGIRRSGVVRDASGKLRRIYFLHEALPLGAEDLRALKRTVEVIAEARRLSAAQGAHLLVVFIPDQFRVFHSVAKLDPQCECRNWTVNDLPERLEKGIESESSEIGFLDLTPALTDAVKRGVIPYFTDDNHWSPDGHRIAAKAIGDYLLARR
jgi:hypothetical protein